ncbi:MAG: 16S rRNA pseudouridine(516) synthase RsuA [Porticoccaceae bacterium]|nr:16S rRNA pseudouridine(516) synthase RsuA [Porticoccaceae bacterium]
MRLDKFISQVTDHSRKDVKKLLKDGVVTIDGKPVFDPSLHIAPTHVVRLGDQLLAEAKPRYFMLNKPKGYVCASKDSDHQIVLDLLDEANKDKLQIAGRLDIDTTGLVLITDDGQWNHAITSPRRACNKHYYVCTADAIAPETKAKFAKGVLLDGEKKPTKPAILDLLFANEAHLTISEGRYHQVKRMFAAVGNRVVELHREQIGDITLDPDLAEGEYRPLREDEINSVYRQK